MVKVEAVVYVSTEDGSQYARSAEVPVSVNTGESSVNAKSVEVAVSVNTGDGSLNAQIATDHIYAELTEQRIIQVVEHQGPKIGQVLHSLLC